MPQLKTEETRLEYFTDKTLVAALEKIPGARESEMRFIGFGAEERCFTYRQLYTEARSRAAHLVRLGLQKGDRLVLMMSEAHEFVMSFMACVLAGIVPAPISPPMTAKAGENFLATAARIIDDSGAQALLTTDSCRYFAEQMIQRASGSGQLLTTETAFASAPPPFEPPPVEPEDICFLQYTSGSTTTPRGVMVTHANLMANITGFLGPHGLNVGPDDVGVSWLPLYHDMGLIGFILGPLIYIGPLIIISTTSFARDPRVWLKAINKYRGTITFAPNFAYSQVMKRLRDQDLEKMDLSCLRVIGCGAEPIQVSTLRSFAERLAPVGFRAEALLPSYGLAESTLAVSLHQREAPLRIDRIDAESMTRGRAIPATDESRRAIEVVSCGFAFPDHEVAIVNEEGAILPEREIGEVVVKGPSVTKGYFRNPEATAAAWQDGWLHTGDLGYLTKRPRQNKLIDKFMPSIEDQFSTQEIPSTYFGAEAKRELFICGRKKELIIIRGANYYPQDIELIVRDLPGVKRGNVAAFSVAEGGEERLVIMAEADAREGGELRQLIATRIQEAIGLEVNRVVLTPVGALLRTTSGKLQRRKIKQLYEQGELAKLND